MQNEIFKEITDFPGYYVSNKGNVYSTVGRPNEELN